MTLIVEENQELILIADPRILSIPVQESHEPMIDIINQNELLFGPSPEIENNTDYTRMRFTVYQKLLQAQRKLPEKIRFCLYEGYRSLGLQKFLFDFRYEKMSKRYPGFSKTELFNETIKMVSPVINLDGSANVPPHSTGAAVDIYLVDHQGEPLDMGIHPADWLQDEDGRLSLTDSIQISSEARKNRELMSKVLHEVGFVNYPTEYWHWSYGDRYWAYIQKKPYAVYDVLGESSF